MENTVTININDIAESLLYSYRFHKDEEFSHWQSAIRAVVGNEAMADVFEVMNKIAEERGYARK